MISYDKSLSGKKIPYSIFNELTYDKVMSGIHAYYNRYLIAPGEAAHDILINLPYRVYYFGNATGKDFRSVLVLGSDEATGETKYGLWLGWCSGMLAGSHPPILRPMWEQVGTRPWKLVDFERAIRAGFTSEVYTAEKFFSCPQYVSSCRRLGDCVCMETFRSILLDAEMPFDVEEYNKEVDRLDLPYVDELSLKMTLSYVVADIRDSLERDGMLEDKLRYD